MVERRYLPLSDAWDDHAPGALTWLQAWYATQCDGDWEHGEGIAIETLDNPGWHVRIDVEGTSAEALALEPEEVHRGEHDWYVVRRTGNSFDAACGPLNLGEVLHAFRLWVEGPPALPGQRPCRAWRTRPDHVWRHNARRPHSNVALAHAHVRGPCWDLLT